jgi:hypothetical protein
LDDQALSDKGVTALLERVVQDGSDVLVHFDGGRSERIVSMGQTRHSSGRKSANQRRPRNVEAVTGLSRRS